jgi:hypothetical protein
MINLNDSTPAPPAGGTNVKWQEDVSGNTSAYIAFGGVPTMNTTTKLSLTPPAGSLVFDTTLGKLCVYTGSAWETVTSS